MMTFCQENQRISMKADLFFIHSWYNNKKQKETGDESIVYRNRRHGARNGS